MRKLSIVAAITIGLNACAAEVVQDADAPRAQPNRTEDAVSPEAFLGRPVGTDFELADWDEVSGYYRLLGEQAETAQTTRIGETTEGRDFLLTVISSPENLQDLDAIRERAAVLADPRNRTEDEKRDAIDHGKVILLVSPQMHSTEAGCTEAIMRFAYELATSTDEPWASAREKLVVGIFPCTNPDGLDRVVHWYREHVGTPFEATGLLELYQLYSGHDNNRDWFMLTQAETRIVTEQLYTVWRPQVYWDVHQQGSRRERMFVPPFRDPLNPNLDPAIITGIDVIGSRALMDMTRAGLTGVATGVTYDMWWNGGNRNVPVRHNIIGLLTEAASVDLASPIFQRVTDLSGPGGAAQYGPSNQFPAPWPGGWWRLADINEHQFQFGKSLVGTLAREREFWLRNALEAAERTIARGREDAPRAWIVPSDNRDPDAVRRLVDVLMRTGVEVHTAGHEVDADGRTYPSGSIVILRDQPYGNHVKDLLEVQRYPDGAPPYDVAGWTLPLLLGVRRVEVMGAIEADLTHTTALDDAVAAFHGSNHADGEESRLPAAHSSTWSTVFQRLGQGQAFTYAVDERGAWFVRSDEAAPGDPHQANISSSPRIGLYAPWSGSMDEGWMRWVLDTWQIPYERVRNEHIRAGDLKDFLDVLIIADIGSRQLDEGRVPGTIPERYARGLAPEGAVAVEEFVRTGGKLITLDSSSDWAIDLFGIPLVNVTREETNPDFSCPGSVLRAIPAGGTVFTAGLPQSLAVFFSRSSAWREMTKDERAEARLDGMNLRSMLDYAPTRLLLSGWISHPEAIEGRMAWVHAEYGEGDLHLFGFRPQYRGWSQMTFSLIFRAILLDEPLAERTGKDELENDR